MVSKVVPVTVRNVLTISGKKKVVQKTSEEGGTEAGHVV